MKTFLTALTLVFALAISAQSPPASSISSVVPLTWRANTESNLSHYTVYWGETSGLYSHRMTVPIAANPPTASVTLTSGSRWFFVVTASNVSGLESDPSNEISVTVPSQSDRPASPTDLFRGAISTTITSVTTISNVVTVPHSP